ncbi:MAG: PaaI family thioesterase, partial [Pseudomonadota bacterium]
SAGRKEADAPLREAERNRILALLTETVPYNRMLGVQVERRGDELTARLPFAPHLVGNPFLPAIHGGVTGSFLEITGVMQLAWEQVLAQYDAGGEAAAAVVQGRFPDMPKTIDVSIDYLRSGRPRDTFARARVQKSGRKVAHVHVEAWQEQHARPIAMLRGNFLMPDN